MDLKAYGIDNINPADRSEKNISINDPDVLAHILVELINRVALELVSFARKDVKPVAIVAVETEVGADPGEAAVILCNGVDKAVGKSVGSRDVLNLPVVGGLCSYGL